MNGTRARARAVPPDCGRATRRRAIGLVWKDSSKVAETAVTRGFLRPRHLPGNDSPPDSELGRVVAAAGPGPPSRQRDGDPSARPRPGVTRSTRSFGVSHGPACQLEGLSQALARL